MTLIGYTFPKLDIAKEVTRRMSKKPLFRTPFDSQHVKRSQILVKYAFQLLYNVFQSLWGKLCWKSSLLVIRELLELFVNILTTDDKYSLLNSEILPKLIQMQLSKK